MTYCLTCSLPKLKAWRGWPLRDKIPVLETLADDACAKCGGRDALNSADIVWYNVHGPHNTGLPEYWELKPRPSFTKDDFDWLRKKWGVPYERRAPCPRCGGVALRVRHADEGRVECAHCPARPLG